MIKHAGGVLIPVDEYEAEKMDRIKNGTQVPFGYKESRNQRFHGKMFAFFNYCFQYWDGQSMLEFANRGKQFDSFRKHLTILAGYHHQTYDINGNMMINADSLSFANMAEDEFRGCYSAIVNAAMEHVFKGCDESEYDRLMSFF